MGQGERVLSDMQRGSDLESGLCVMSGQPVQQMELLRIFLLTPRSQDASRCLRDLKAQPVKKRVTTMTSERLGEEELSDLSEEEGLRNIKVNLITRILASSSANKRQGY